MKAFKLLAGAALGAGLWVGAATAAPYQLKLVTTVALPGTAGHGDFVLYDPGTRDIYLTLPKTGLVAIDTRTNKVAHTIEDIPNSNSMAFTPGYIYATSAGGQGKTNELVVIDKKTWQVVDHVPTKGTSPDGIWADPARHRLYVAMDDDNTIEAYSTGAHPKFIGKYPLYPAKAQAGPDVGTFVHSKDVLYMPVDSYVEIMNMKTGKITRHADLGMKLTKKGGTKGIIYDPAKNELWVGTTDAGVYVLNATSLKVVKHLPAHGGIDEVSFDPRLGLVYAFEGGAKGFDVFDAKDMEPVAFVKTDVGNTHTGAADPATHMVYAYEGDGKAVGVYEPVKAGK